MCRYSKHLFDGKIYYDAKDKNNKDSNNIFDVLECVGKECGFPLLSLEADGQSSSVKYRYDHQYGACNILWLQNEIQKSTSSFPVSLYGEYLFDNDGSIFVKEPDSIRPRKVLIVNKGTGNGRKSLD